MKHCEACGKELIGGNRHRRFCNSTCRSRHHRAKKAAAKKAAETQFKSKVDSLLAGYFPKTARSLLDAAFFELYGPECAEKALNVSMVALREIAQRTTATALRA